MSYFSWNVVAMRERMLGEGILGKMSDRYSFLVISFTVFSSGIRSLSTEVGAYWLVVYEYNDEIECCCLLLTYFLFFLFAILNFRLQSDPIFLALFLSFFRLFKSYGIINRQVINHLSYQINVVSSFLAQSARLSFRSFSIS